MVAETVAATTAATVVATAMPLVCVSLPFKGHSRHMLHFAIRV